MLRGNYLSPLHSRPSYFLSCVTKIPSLLMYQSFRTYSMYPVLHRYRTSSFTKLIINIHRNNFSMEKRASFCTLALSKSSPAPESLGPASNTLSNKSKKKARRESPEGVLKHKLDMCSRHGHVVEALSLYDDARKNGVPLSQHHYNVLLYLCSSGSAESNASASNVGLERGFEIFQQMISDKVDPNEATFTSLARVAVAKEDPEMAFDLVKQMKRFGITPRLRSYGPALFGFCKITNADKAYEVDEHMAESGLIAEEPELAALLKLSASAKKGNKVYEMLHRLRPSVRQVSETTFGIIEDWFQSEDAAKFGKVNWDVRKVRDGITRGGGGWHGQGWLGTGKWRVQRTQMTEKGVCRSCGEQLSCIDIDPKETENFASSLAKLACQREAKADFNKFQVMNNLFILSIEFLNSVNIYKVSVML